MKITFCEDARRQQIQLAKAARNIGLDEATVESLVNSGYILVSQNPLVGGDGIFVCDSFYGSKTPPGFFPLEQLTSGRSVDAKIKLRRIEVSSVHEIQNFLREDPSLRKFSADGRVTFRGQPREYRIKREYPNPFIADEEGEISMLPSHWRRFRDDFRKRCEPEFWSIFSNAVGKVVLSGPLRRALDAHTQNQEVEHHFSGEIKGQFAALEQHYGFPTVGLDVTFDLATAIFFSRHECVTVDGLWDYVPVGTQVTYLYAFVFRDPAVIETRDLLETIDIFPAYPAVRVQRQRAALVGCGMYSVNIAVPDVAAIFELQPGFTMIGSPEKEWLFPPPESDPFFGALLEEKRTNPGLLHSVAEYFFHRRTSR